MCIFPNKRFFQCARKHQFRNLAHSGTDFISGSCEELSKRLISGSSHHDNLGLGKMLSHPFPEIWAEVPEVRRLIHAGGETTSEMNRSVVSSLIRIRLLLRERNCSPCSGQLTKYRVGVEKVHFSQNNQSFGDRKCLEKLSKLFVGLPGVILFCEFCRKELFNAHSRFDSQPGQLSVIA